MAEVLHLKDSLELFENVEYKDGTISTHVENKKPEVGASGLNGISYDTDEQLNPIVAEPIFSYKADATMSSKLPEETENQSPRFIKYIPGEKSNWLFNHNLNAFLLLMAIAQRARFIDDPLTGLKAGECFIGDYKEYGIETEKKYRIAKKVLLEFGFIEIVETCRTRKRATEGRPTGKKRATETTTIGTKVKIIDSSIWDINLNDNGDRKGDRRATDWSEKGDEQECKERERKKEDKKKNTTYSKKKTPDKPAAAPSADALELVKFFFSSFFENIPEIAGKKNLQHNINYHTQFFEKLLKNYSVEQIQKTITFAHKDAFWRLHVHTPSYFKAKFEKLYLKASETTQTSQATQEREWENYNRNNFFEAKKIFGKELKGIEYRNGYVINQASGKEVHCKMHPDRFKEVFAAVAGIKVQEW